MSELGRVEQEMQRLEEEIAAIREEWRAAPTAGDLVEDVRRELAAMVAVDQLVRGRFASDLDLGGVARRALTFRLGRRMSEVDAAHTARLRELLDAHGWFTVSRWGAETDEMAWLLVQHADHDVALQRRVLETLEPLVEAGETSPSNFAYLYDRVATNEGRPQRYGTQGRCIGPGNWEPNRLEDPDEVDSLRAAVGLDPLAEYRRGFVELCR